MNTMLYVPHCCHVCFTGSHLHLFAGTALPTGMPVNSVLSLIKFNTHRHGQPTMWLPCLLDPRTHTPGECQVNPRDTRAVRSNKGGTEQKVTSLLLI